ncbi:hypothetical protein, partial [Methylorubrum extorquens]
FLDIDPSSWLESHTKGRTTPLGADQSSKMGRRGPERRQGQNAVSAGHLALSRAAQEAVRLGP